MMKLILFIFLNLLLADNCMSITGFECAHRESAFSVYATNEIESCVKRSSPYNLSDVTIQVLQKNKFININYIGCYITINYLITHCGSGSHASLIDRGFIDLPVSRSVCEEMIYTGKFPSFGKLHLTGAPLNMNHVVSGIARGSINQETGYCEGETFEWDGRMRYNGILSLKIDVGLFKGQGVWDTSTDNVLIEHQAECKRDSPRCRSQSHGNIFFETNFTKSCGSDDVSQLYFGDGSFINHTNGQMYVIVSSKQRSFALALKDEIILCNQRVWYTGTDGLFVLMSNKSSPQKIQTTSDHNVKIMDLELEMLSKLLQIDQERTKDLNHQVAEIEYQFCLERRETYKNMLALSYLEPDEFAYAFVGGPGFQAIRKGELIYLIKCTPIPVTPWNDVSSCFDEMPVNVSGKLMFLKPKSRVLVDKGTQIECDSMMPSGYKFANHWYSIDRMRIAPPSILNPNIKLNVTFSSVLDFNPSGLYTEEDINRMRDKIMFDEKQDVVNNIVTRQVMGLDVEYQGYKLLGNLASHDVEMIGTSLFGKLFYILDKIGAVTSCIIGILVIYRSIKACYLVITNFAVLSRHDVDLTVRERLLLSISNRDTLLHLIKNPNTPTYI